METLSSAALMALFSRNRVYCCGAKNLWQKWRKRVSQNESISM
jgi:hypothetical protein